MGGASKTLLSRTVAASGRQDGKIVLLSTTRQRKSKGAAIGGFGANLEVLRDMVFDLDARRVVEHVTDGMAEFFEDRLRKGLRPDRGTLPEASEQTRGLARRKGQRLGQRSGWMAENWDMGKIFGSSINARSIIKPPGDSGHTTPSRVEVAPGGRAFVITNLLRRKHEPVDFQSVKGAAGVRLRELFVEAIGEGMPSSVLVRGAGQRRFKKRRVRR